MAKGKRGRPKVNSLSSKQENVKDGVQKDQQEEAQSPSTPLVSRSPSMVENCATTTDALGTKRTSKVLLSMEEACEEIVHGSTTNTSGKKRICCLSFAAVCVYRQQYIGKRIRKKK